MQSNRSMQACKNTSFPRLKASIVGKRIVSMRDAQQASLLDLVIMSEW